jgi:4-hydroxy-3-polyprenylbenzoate decarboxylase
MVSDSLEAIIERCQGQAKPGTHVVIMSNGGFGGLHGKLAEALNDGPERITLAMTGASGAQYGLRLLDCLVREDREVHFLISKAAQLVMATETDVTLPAKPQRCRPSSPSTPAPPPGRSACTARKTGCRRWPRVRRAGGDGGGAVFHRYVVGDCHRRLQQPDRARRRRHA